MPFLLGRGMAPAAAAVGLLFADALLTEQGRPLATQSRLVLLFELPPTLTAESGAFLAAENDVLLS